MGNPNSSQREIDQAFYEVSQELAGEELGGRRRSIFCRNRSIRSNQDLDLGVWGSPDQYWQEITPTPAAHDINRSYTEDRIGLIQVGDIQLVVDRLAIPRDILSAAEFYINDDPDAEPPDFSTVSNYNLLNGSVIEGGGGIRGRFPSSWICILRRCQVNVG